MPGEVAMLVSDATPYMTAAVAAYGSAVLAKARDDASDATVGLGLRLLQRVLGRRAASEPLPAPLADLVADPGDADALGALRLAIRRALEADAVMVADVRSLLAAARSPTVMQHVHAGRDAYVAGHDLAIKRVPDSPGDQNSLSRMDVCY